MAIDDRVVGALHQAENELLFTAEAQALTADSGTSGFGFENIVGVGVSERIVAGRSVGETTVSVYVVRKAPVDEVNPPSLVPDTYEGVPTDVIESGEFLPATERGRHRPVPLGVSIGHVSADTGTVGFVAKRNGELLLVSNNHVLARENQASKGDDIVQPGPADGGSAVDKVAELDSWIALDFRGANNPIDAAMATVDCKLVSGQLYSGGALVANPAQATRKAKVRKCGRTTGVTQGVVTDVNATIKLRYPVGVALLSDQVLIQGIGGKPFSEAGDSGSLVVDERSSQPVGLLCGGSSRFTLANRIDQVLAGLGVSFGP